MSNHSRKPPLASDPRAVWSHCRRPGCGAKPYIPSEVDPSFCEACAIEYVGRGLQFYPLCAHWRPADGTQRKRCADCWQAARRAMIAAARERYAARNPDWAAERRKTRHAREWERIKANRTRHAFVVRRHRENRRRRALRALRGER